MIFYFLFFFNFLAAQCFLGCVGFLQLQRTGAALRCGHGLASLCGVLPPLLWLLLLRSCSTRAQQLWCIGLSCSLACGILPDQQLSPALAGGFLPPGSSVHGLLQARILECVAMHSPRGSSRPRYRTQVSCTAGRFPTIWATREAAYPLHHQGSPNCMF